MAASSLVYLRLVVCDLVAMSKRYKGNQSATLGKEALELVQAETAAEDRDTFKSENTEDETPPDTGDGAP
eukprot:5013898-Amphidinium_carterae.1